MSPSIVRLRCNGALMLDFLETCPKPIPDKSTIAIAIANRRAQAEILEMPLRLEKHTPDEVLPNVGSESPDGTRHSNPHPKNSGLRYGQGKSREPREDSGRIQMLEERIKFMEVATQRALNEVARRQDGSIDKRIRRAVGPLHEEQRRLNDAVGPLGDQMQKLATTVSRQMEELKNAVLSSRHLESAGGFT
ncbi:hypothetical protein SLS54_010100 [Diplodia seriata]